MQCQVHRQYCRQDHRRIVILTSSVALALGGCASTSPTPGMHASARAGGGAGKTTHAKSTAQLGEVILASASGSLVSGKLMLTPMGNGVHITGEVGGVLPGSTHGFHIHENGDCSAADASTAGGHFNPAGQPHGRAIRGAHHAGDSDNIVADASGVTKINTHIMGVSLGGGAANDIAGRAFVVHAAADDYASQPSGNAGARVACGVIRATR